MFSSFIVYPIALIIGFFAGSVSAIRRPPAFKVGLRIAGLLAALIAIVELAVLPVVLGDLSLDLIIALAGMSFLAALWCAVFSLAGFGVGVGMVWFVRRAPALWSGR